VIGFTFFEINGGGAISVQFDKELLGISGIGKQHIFIHYNDIESVELVNSIDIGIPVQVSDWNNGWSGIYQNGVYGQYTLFAYSQPGLFIVMRYMNDEKRPSVAVFNEKSEKRIQNLYSVLKELTE
jgi:hypothetical protein